MSWQEIAPAAQKSASRNPVQFAIGRQLGRGTGRPTIVQLTLRTQQFEVRPAWLRAGKSVKASVGRGEHFGMIRIVPGGAHPLAKCGGSSSSGESVMVLRLPIPPGISSAPGRSACEFDYGADWLEVTIPEWALVPADASPPVASARPPLAKKPGYSMVGDVRSSDRRAT